MTHKIILDLYFRSVEVRHDTVFWTSVASLPFREKDITIHPNPTTQQLFFKIENPSGCPTSVNIYAFDGRLMFSQKRVLQTENVVPISNLPNGLYFLEIKDERGRVAKKFISQ